jgi:hypothetical protein
MQDPATERCRQLAYSLGYCGTGRDPGDGGGAPPDIVCEREIARQCFNVRDTSADSPFGVNQGDWEFDLLCTFGNCEETPRFPFGERFFR